MKLNKKEKAWIGRVRLAVNECARCGGSGRTSETPREGAPCDLCAPIRIAMQRVLRLPNPLSFSSLYSDDDGVVLFDTHQEALSTKKYWERLPANEVRGPFDHFDVEMSS